MKCCITSFIVEMIQDGGLAWCSYIYFGSDWDSLYYNIKAIGMLWAYMV